MTHSFLRSPTFVRWLHLEPVRSMKLPNMQIGCDRLKSRFTSETCWWARDVWDFKQTKELTESAGDKGKYLARVGNIKQDTRAKVKSLPFDLCKSIKSISDAEMNDPRVVTGPKAARQLARRGSISVDVNYSKPRKATCQCYASGLRESKSSKLTTHLIIAKWYFD